MSDRWSEFVDESTERITRLNNELLALERDPDDKEAMRNIFRTAHTLKGNAGAAGFESAGDLAHAIEDLLDAIRSGRLEVSSDLMDVVFDGVDELEEMVSEIEATGEIRTDPSPTIRTIRAELEHDSPVTSVEPPSAAAIDSFVSRIDPPADDDHDAYLARFAVSEDETAEPTNGTLVLEALSDAFDLVGTDPPRQRIVDGEYDGQLDAVFGSAVGETAIGAALEPIDVIADFELVDITDRLEAATTQPDASPQASTLSEAEAQDLEVDDLLDEFEEFDDLEEKVKEVENDDDLEVFEEMGDAGSFDDLFESADVADPDLEPGTPSTEQSPETTADTTSSGSTSDDDVDDVDDAGAVFDELKDEVDPVGFEELQEELDELEFDEFDEEEVGMNDLLGEEFEDDDDPASDAADGFATEPTTEPPSETDDSIAGEPAAESPQTASETTNSTRSADDSTGPQTDAWEDDTFETPETDGLDTTDGLEASDDDSAADETALDETTTVGETDDVSVRPDEDGADDPPETSETGLDPESTAVGFDEPDDTVEFERAVSDEAAAADSLETDFDDSFEETAGSFDTSETDFDD
ncbi:Hpt domain-containing protein, partial [Salinadaptatus halalkaliphilus]|uniref:Hpt domain-containing protein n=1 Tax=Salinadaptatus halalkaliphilus TaxID=2419781 RepID=UPI001C2BE31B